MPIYDHAGNAPATTVTSAFNQSDLVCQCNSLTNWPAGGANGKFWVTFDRNGPNEMRCLAQATSGNTLTFASTGDKGLEGTANVDIPIGTIVEHTFSKTEAEDANSHIFDTTRDDHTQYFNAARHAATTHTQGMMGTDSIGAAQIIAGAVGTSELATGAVTANELAALAVIAGKIANGAINLSSLFTAGVVDAAALASSSVTSAKIAADAVIAGKIADGAVDTTATIADGIISMAKFLSEPAVDWGSSLTINNVTLGTGGSKYARYWKFGRLVVMLMGFELGSGTGNVTGTIQFTLPFTPVDIAGFTGSNAGAGFTAASARDASASLRYSGIGAVRKDTLFATDYVIAGAGTGWNATTPFDWTNGDTLEAVTIFLSTT